MPCYTRIIMTCYITAGILIQNVNASQELNISGKVMDLLGSPVSGATVKVNKVGKSAVTDSNGNFSVSGNTSINASLNIEAVHPNVTLLSRGKIEIRTLKRTLASITGFTLNGKAIFKKEYFVDAGVYVFSTPSLMHGVTLLKVTADGRTAYLKTYIPGGMIQKKVQTESNPVFSETSAKQTVAALFKDTIFVTKSDYLEYALRIDKPEIGGLNIRIAKKDHPKITQKHIFKIGSAPFNQSNLASILELPDGTLLCAFVGGMRGELIDEEIRLCRKEPGKDWTAPISVANGIFDGRRNTTGSPALFQTFDGKIILFYQIIHVGTRWGMMKTSTDGGNTWSEMRNICESCIGPEKNKPVQLENGTILSPSADRNGGSGIRVEISKDNGETWSTGKGIGGGIQPTIMIHPDNHLQMMFRTAPDVKKIGVTWSDDLGVTWSGPMLSILPHNSAGIDAVTLRDGRQLLAYNHSTRNQAGMGHRGCGFLTVSLSKDGKAWEAGLIINYTTYKTFQHSYPAIIQSRNGLVNMVHTWGRLTINHVVINPKILETVPMPDGKWPSSGPLSLKEWKKANPNYDRPEH